MIYAFQILSPVFCYTQSWSFSFTATQILLTVSITCFKIKIKRLLSILRRSIVSGVKIEHIAMYVNDLEGAKKFFEKYFDAKANGKYHNINTNFQSYFLSFGNASRLEIMTRPDVTDDEKFLQRTGYIHLAFSVGSRGNVDVLTKRLQSDGYEVISGPRITGDGYYESCVIGFEGNQIEITV